MSFGYVAAFIVSQVFFVLLIREFIRQWPEFWAGIKARHAATNHLIKHMDWIYEDEQTGERVCTLCDVRFEPSTYFKPQPRP